MKRKRMSKKASKNLFKRTARVTHRKNLRRAIGRGGFAF